MKNNGSCWRECSLKTEQRMFYLADTVKRPL
jgi:hypothetical protein